MDKLSDEMLVAHFQGGRQDAFDILMSRYKQKIYAYLLRSVKNYEDAEELTIEVFIKIYRALGTWEPRAKFTTWIYRIAHNLSIDHYRAKSRRTTAYLDDENSAIDEPASMDRRSNPENGVLEKDRHRIIGDAMEQLSPNQRSVFIMSRYDCLQIKEIAEILGMAEGTVKIHLHRAVKKLKNILQPMWDKGEI